MWRSVHDAWWRLATQHHPRSFADRLACRALSAGSLLYQTAIGVRNAGFDRGWAKSVRLPCVVVSVGNLTVGGTGKTTCSEYLAQKLAGLGRRVAVLSRGYGGAQREYVLRWDGRQLLQDGQPLSHPDGLADEPQLLARHLSGVPVLVGANRSKTGRVACTQLGADALVLDDGFQHRQLHRDCDVVLVHARMPLSGWPLLPRGPMREPLSALRRANVIVVTKADEALSMLSALRERLRAINRHATIVTAAHEPDRLIDGSTGADLGLARLDGLRVGLLSSIGDPEGFEATVRRLHATIVSHRAFPDHHRYQPADLASLTTVHSGARADALLTTEKDWVRLKPMLGAEGSGLRTLWVLTVRLNILDGESELDDRLARVCAR